MGNSEGLYLYALQNDIVVDAFSMSYAEAFSLPLGNGAIVIDPFKLRSTADERVKLAHELGHCETWSFYNRYSPFDVVAQHENRADKWAIKNLVPKDELYSALKNGYTEIWELAEIFDVTEIFMRKALNWYLHGSVCG